VEGTTVFVVAGDRVEKREVEVGIRGTRAVEILAGLKEEERVASPAAAGLADARRIRVKEQRAPRS
jgi:multidrug efflux pump subunit AcrA (membrane-fusion protein)